jgi:hypothetical protein
VVFVSYYVLHIAVLIMERLLSSYGSVFNTKEIASIPRLSDLTNWTWTTHSLNLDKGQLGFLMPTISFLSLARTTTIVTVVPLS